VLVGVRLGPGVGVLVAVLVLSSPR